MGLAFFTPDIFDIDGRVKSGYNPRPEQKAPFRGFLLGLLSGCLKMFADRMLEVGLVPIFYFYFGYICDGQ